MMRRNEHSQSQVKKARACDDCGVSRAKGKCLWGGVKWLSRGQKLDVSTRYPQVVEGTGKQIDLF